MFKPFEMTLTNEEQDLVVNALRLGMSTLDKTSPECSYMNEALNMLLSHDRHGGLINERCFISAR